MQEDGGIVCEMEALGGAIDLTDLFPPEWMQEHTETADVVEFLDASGYDVQTHEELQEIPTGRWDAHVDATTEFDCWSEMVSSALEEYAD